jgi:hypothetical protein
MALDREFLCVKFIQVSGFFVSHPELCCINQRKRRRSLSIVLLTSFLIPFLYYFHETRYEQCHPKFALLNFVPSVVPTWQLWAFWHGNITNVQVEVFWIVTPCTVAVGYQGFGGPYWRRKDQGPPKRWYLTVTLHGVTTQKTSTSLFFSAVKTATLAIQTSFKTVVKCYDKSP